MWHFFRIGLFWQSLVVIICSLWRNKTGSSILKLSQSKSNFVKSLSNFKGARGPARIQVTTLPRSSIWTSASAWTSSEARPPGWGTLPATTPAPATMAQPAAATRWWISIKLSQIGLSHKLEGNDNKRVCSLKYSMMNFLSQRRQSKGRCKVMLIL